MSRGAIYEQTVFGHRWRRTPGIVGFDNPGGTACEDCKMAKQLRQQSTFEKSAFMMGDCWDDHIRKICAACEEEEKCPSSKPPPFQPPPGYAGGG